MIGFIVIFVALLVPNVGCAQCPPTQLVFPCECSNDVIFCGYSETLYLKNVFSAIAQYLENDNKSYLILDLKGIAITDLKDNAFSGLQFKRIFLRDLTRLSHIGVKAFDGTQLYTEELTVEGDNKLLTEENFHEFSAAVSGLTNLKTLYLDVYHMTSVPSKAFTNRKLLDIDFNFNRRRNGTLQTISDLAFHHQRELMDLDLTHQMIGFIPKNAFTFEGHSKRVLHIFLDHNQLNSSSFELGLFNRTNRVVELSLKNNQIEYLDEKIFAPFFTYDSNNKIDLSDNPLVIDCRMAWILKYREIVPFNQILGGETADGKHLIFIDSDYFKNC